MRWALVILILYILPIVILFKNKKDFKRSSIYGCIYTVVASVIVISNIYISTLNKMEDILENRKFAIDEKHKKIKTHQKKNVYKQDDNNKIKGNQITFSNYFKSGQTPPAPAPTYTAVGTYRGVGGI